MGTGELNAGGNHAMDKHPIQGGVEIIKVASWYRIRDKLRPDGPLGSYVDLTYLETVVYRFVSIHCWILAPLFATTKIRNIIINPQIHVDFLY